MAYELEKSLGFKINHTTNKLNSKYIKLLQSFNIAPEQRATLEIIKYEKDVNQTKIANILAKDKTTISRTLSTLEKKGLISKKAIDKRTNLITLTKEGDNILLASATLVKKFRASLSKNLSDEEIEFFVNILNKISLNIESN
ncbi:MAG: MarR family transcriptional regulator [Arcobacteraceae bacterium]